MTTARTYQEQNKTTKEVTLPSGVVFTIKKITGRDMLKAGVKMPIASSADMSNGDEKSKILWEKMTDEQRTDAVRFNDALVCLACVSPVVKNAPQAECKDEELSVESLSEEDYYHIMHEASSFMGGGKDPKSFCAEQLPADTGLGSQEVRSETVTAS